MPPESNRFSLFRAWFDRNRHANMTFLGYAATGGLTQLIDLGSFATFVRLHLPVEIATTVAICIATATHFCLNKYVNFKNHERPVAQQFGTYLTVGAASLLLSVAIVSVLTRVLHVPPIVAKITATAINFPFNFLCHKYLTFAGGIRSFFALRRARRLETDVIPRPKAPVLERP
jgi:putative flippase GtrA